MPIKKGEPRVYFPKVKEAREALAAKAVDLFEAYYAFVQECAAEGQKDIANEGYQFLIKHMPKDPNEVGMIDANVDKDVKGGRNEGKTGPTIQIGIALSQPKTLPAAPVEVIDVTDDTE